MVLSLISVLLAFHGAFCSPAGWGRIPVRERYYLIGGMDDSVIGSPPAHTRSIGTYAYMEPIITIEYTAGDRGYNPKADGGSSGSPSVTGVEEQVSAPSAAASSSAATAARDEAAPPQATADQSGSDSPAGVESAKPTDLQADGSYSFQFDAGDHSRQEEADASGRVKGAFTFVSKEDGLTRKIEYDAGPDTGFVARGDHLPKVPEVLAYPSESAKFTSSRAEDGSYKFSYEAADHSREESSDARGNVRGTFSYVPKGDESRRRVEYEASARTGFIIKPQAAKFQAEANPKADPRYSFSYDAGDHSREETSDSDGNVLGSFTFVAADDGQTRKTAYKAGHSSGFIATGDHLPVGKKATATDGSYEFSFDAGDHSREESSDAFGNVRGSYAFIPRVDATKLSVYYEAGADKGFSARGSHLPSAPEASGAYSLSSKVGAHSKGASSEHKESSADAHRSSVNTVEEQTPHNGALAYEYSYDAGTSRKEEKGDVDGNVVGTFSYISGDGITRKVHYTASDSRGYVATGDLIPKFQDQTLESSANP